MKLLSIGGESKCSKRNSCSFNPQLPYFVICSSVLPHRIHCLAVLPCPDVLELLWTAPVALEDLRSVYKCILCVLITLVISV